jgi:hypothetical protein
MDSRRTELPQLRDERLDVRVQTLELVGELGIVAS